MATRRKNSRPVRATALAPTPRHLWLAALGALVAVRRESLRAIRGATLSLTRTPAGSGAAQAGR